MKANPTQIKAINAIKGPSLIIAGAGTGKTFVITQKIHELITTHKVSPSQILALTFTEKAAYEMQQRVDETVPYGYYQATITTFHSFADTLLREYGYYMGIPSNYRILTEVDAQFFMRRHIDEFAPDIFRSTSNPFGFIDVALAHFSRLRDEGIDPSKYSKAALSEEHRELARMYETYVSLKWKENKLDYSDLVYYLLQLIRNKSQVKQALQKQYSYALIDEFQDTNNVQYNLIKELFPASANLTVIGDDNQSIYKFRGASISNILTFQKDYPKAKCFILNINYRSKQSILDSAYRLITHNNPDTLEARLGISKKLIAHRKGKGETVVRGFQNGEEEAEAVVAHIKKAVEEGCALRDCAVLVRANDHAKPFVQACERHGIRYQFLGPNLLFNKAEVRDLLALLRFITDPSDSISLLRLLLMKTFSLTYYDLIPFNLLAKKFGISLYESIRSMIEYWDGRENDLLEHAHNSLPRVNQLVRDSIRKAYRILHMCMSDSLTKPATAIIYRFLDESGYLSRFAAPEGPADTRRLELTTQFYRYVRSIEGASGEASAQEVIHHIALAIELAETPYAMAYDISSENAVNILTVHGSKGLEFSHVYMISMTSDRFPSRERKEKVAIPPELVTETLPIGDAHIAEERRLCYVGITRACNSLWMSFSLLYGSGKRKKLPSPFIIESFPNETIGYEPEIKKIYELRGMSELEEMRKNVPLPKMFSYSQIETYSTCPLQYYYRYVLKIPEPENPALLFGSAIHKALELMYREVRDGNVPSKDILLKNFDTYFIPMGYKGKDAIVKDKIRAQNILAWYFDTQFEKTDIVALEHPFTIRLENGEKGTALVTGKIDRIDKRGSEYEIIDYKTGKKPLDATLKKSIQLSLYSLAASDKFLLNAPLSKIILRYIYLDAQESVSFRALEANIEEARQKMVTVINDIKHMKFQPVKGYHCEWCPFQPICPAWET